MAKVVAVANQKGGVAKTTTVQALGVALAQADWRVLAVDLDPQACLTYSFGFDPDRLSGSLHDVLVGRSTVADVTRAVPGVPGLDLAPATIDLAGAEVHLLTKTGREHVLARALEPVRADYDVVLLDCPPSLGILTINGLTAAGSVLVPVQCEALSHRGVGQLLETVEDVRMFANADLQVLGVVATMFDGRTRHARQVLDEVGTRYGLTVFDPPVPKSVRFAEAPSEGRSILQHAPGSPGAEAYRSLAGRVGDLLAAKLTVPPEELEPEAESESESESEVEPGRPTRDPLGKRALFSAAPDEDPDGTAVDADSVVGRGPITVTCSTCGVVSRTGVLDFLVYQLPIGYWVPRGRFGHRMTCPSCRRRVWAGVTLR